MCTHMNHGVKGQDHSANTPNSHLANYWSKGVDFDMYTYISNTGEQSVTLTLKVKKIKGHIAIVLKLAYFAKYCSQAVDLI